jgi:hypothetical protein
MLCRIMALNIPDEGHCRNASCSLNLISTFACSCGDIQLIAYYMYNVLVNSIKIFTHILLLGDHAYVLPMHEGGGLSFDNNYMI